MANTKSRGDKRSRGRRKGRSFDDVKKTDTREIDSKKNDASWYTRNQALVADAGKIAFTWPSGVPVELDIPNPNSHTQKFNATSNGRFLTPGIMGLKYVPTYGAEQNGFDALNIASQNVYTYVRHVQSGHSNYDPNDLMLYLMAMDQIYSLYMHLVRAYGTIRLFSQKNRNFPRVLMNSMGFDYDDVASNLADFRYYINNAATRIGAMCVPDNMPIFVRHMWMASSVYADSPSAKAQLYVFRPICFGRYEEKTATTGGYLATNWMDYKHTVSDWCALLNSLIEAVRSSEDCGIISGDILKAYGDKVVKLPFITEDYTTSVVYSAEVLGQIANATVMPEAAYKTVSGFTYTPMFYQDLTNNILKSSLHFLQPLGSGDTDEGANLYLGKRVMIGLSESPTPEEVLVNSRLMVFGHELQTGTNLTYIEPDSLGSEVIVCAAMYDTGGLEKFYNDSNPDMSKYRYLHYVNYATQLANSVQVLDAMAKANYFNLHPSFNIYTHITADNSENWSSFFDVDNYAIVDSHDIAKMHETALLSMLDVPLLGSAK